MPHIPILLLSKSMVRISIHKRWDCQSQKKSAVGKWEACRITSHNMRFCVPPQPSIFIYRKLLSISYRIHFGIKDVTEKSTRTKCIYKLFPPLNDCHFFRSSYISIKYHRKSFRNYNISTMFHNYSREVRVETTGRTNRQTHTYAQTQRHDNALLES